MLHATSSSPSRQRADSRYRLLAVLSTLLALLIALPDGVAHAHRLGLSRGEYRVADAQVEASLSLARDELLAIASALDGDGDDELSDAEAEGGAALFQRRVLDAIVITADSRPCAAALQDIELDGDGVILRARYTCPAGARPLVIDPRGLLRNATPGHRHVGVVHQRDASGELQQHLFLTHFGQRVFEVPSAAVAGSLVDRVSADTRPPEAVTSAPAVQQLERREPTRSGSPLELAGSFLRLGLEHILGGVDHLVFLLGLCLPWGLGLARAELPRGERARPLILAITAFTVGHSLSLALVTLSGWTPDPAWVEPAIALSIVYVGLENHWRVSPPRRYILTLPFGLIHGLGFAGALAELGLPGDARALALVCFNLGVELGQLLVLPLLLAGALALRWRAPNLLRPALRALNLLVTLAGALWFITRVT